MNQKTIIGLTQEQIEEKINAGQVNGDQIIRTKTYGQILRGNLFTLFNLINVVLLVCILLTGSIKNALFFLVVIWNFLIGSFQEIRAKKIIDRLSLLSAPKAYVLRNGQIMEIPVKEIVLGEIMQLKAGHQICADCVVLKGSCQVNESLITGESTPILKREGDHLLSGSFLIAGEVLTEAEHVGSDNYVNQITESAGYYKKPESVIMNAVTQIVRILAIAMIPLTALQVWNNFFRMSSGFSQDMIRTVATISSMIPGGLILLVSIVLAVSVVRLSVHKALVQDLYCVENLARVDTILLDKTGTITEGVLKLEKVIPFAPCTQEKSIDLLKAYMNISVDDNSTALAIREYIFPGQGQKREILSAEDSRNAWSVPFSSERKWGLVQTKEELLILGAPEFLLKEDLFQIEETLDQYSNEGKRVLLLASSSDISIKNRVNDEDYILPDNLIPAALIIISDQVRKEAPDTFDFFRKEQVSIKVITGDSPVTAYKVAKEAGIVGADRWVDASKLKTEVQIGELAENTTVFGRVNPAQKCAIVKALQQKGHTVAMIGDGANDVLALKEADCSIAMQTGSDAARNIANIVLLESDFSVLPLIVAEGRKSINNLQRSSALYLTKTTYSFLFSVFFLFAALVYPFENIQVTLIGAVTIGIPSFFLALEPNSSPIRKNFLWNVFKYAVPGGILEAAALIFLLYRLNCVSAITDREVSSACVYLMLIMGILMIINICGRLNVWKLLLILGLTAAAAGAVLIFPGLLSLTMVSGGIWRLILLICAVFFVLHFVICRVVLPKIEKKNTET